MQRAGVGLRTPDCDFWGLRFHQISVLGTAMRTDLIMVRLVEAIYWFDESLQHRLSELGWDGITRAQSIILANIANGERRPARLAEKLGISKQGISQALDDMAKRQMITLQRDPDDRRAVIIEFAPALEPMRSDAIAILEDLEAMLEELWGAEQMAAVRKALSIEWRQLPDRRQPQDQVAPNADLKSVSSKA